MAVKNKIVMVGSTPPPYHGSNTYFQGLLNSDIVRKYDVHHVDISDHRGLENLSKLDPENVRLALKGISGLRKACIGISPDIVYIPVASNFLPFLRDGLLILTAARYSKAKIVIHLHEGSYFRDEFYQNASLPLKTFIRSALSKVDTAIVYSKRLERIFDGLARRTVSFFNGVDDLKGSSPGKSNRDAGTVTFVGNLFRSKGVISFIRSACIIHNRIPDVRFVICGAWASDRDEVEKELNSYIMSGDLSGVLTFTGAVPADKLEEIYAASDVIVFPTKYPYEGCPIVIIEAMKHGKPVVSSISSGAIPDMITDGVEGFLVEPEDQQAIAEKAIMLLQDDGLRQKMGASARIRYENEFTKQRNISNLIEVFESLLENDTRVQA